MLPETLDFHFLLQDARTLELIFIGRNEKGQTTLLTFSLLI